MAAQRRERRQLQGSTRLQAKRQRRRETRDGQRRRPVISEAEFLARRESVKRDMIVREKDGRVQIAVLEDDVLVEHYVSHQAQQSMAGNVYLARVQNVLPGMEAAFVDVGRGRNAVLYAGEVNWDAAGMEGKPEPHRARAQAGRHRHGAGHQGPHRPQGCPRHVADLARWPLPGLRAGRAESRASAASFPTTSATASRSSCAR